MHAASEALAVTELQLDGVAEMDVAAQDADRGGGVWAGGDLGDQILHPSERAIECSPVLHVESASELLAEPGERAPPRPVADCLIPLLDTVQPTRNEHRQRRRDHKMPARFSTLVND